MSKIVAVIPARLGSSRFPGKVLHQYKGKPLLFYVYQTLLKSRLLDSIIIATDDPQIKEVAEAFGAPVVVTSKRHKTGSDRVAEVARKIHADVYINIQADNFGLNPRVLDNIIERFMRLKLVRFGTMAIKLDDDRDLFNPDTVKVLIGSDNRAVYFSRYPLPYLQGCAETSRSAQFTFYKHIGIYLFTAAGLGAYSRWKRTPFEKAESLEQLRIIENRESLYVFKTRMKTISVDSKNDLEKLESLYT